MLSFLLYLPHFYIHHLFFPNFFFIISHDLLLSFSQKQVEKEITRKTWARWVIYPDSACMSWLHYNLSLRMPVAITTSYYEIYFNNLYFFVSLKITLIYIEHAMSSCNFADHKIKLIFLPSRTGEFLFEHAFRVLMYPLRCLKLFDRLI